MLITVTTMLLAYICVLCCPHMPGHATHYSAFAPDELAGKTTPFKPKPTPRGSGVPSGGSSTTNPSSNSLTSPYIDTTNLHGEDLVGIHVERLNVGVVDGVSVYVAGSQYSIPRLKEHFGKDLCWPVVVSNKRSFAVTCKLSL